MQIWPLDQEDPLDGMVPLDGMATHSSILAWRIAWTEESGGLWSIGSQRVRHDWSDLARTIAEKMGGSTQIKLLTAVTPGEGSGIRGSKGVFYIYFLFFYTFTICFLFFALSVELTVCFFFKHKKKNLIFYCN